MRNLIEKICIFKFILSILYTAKFTYVIIILKQTTKAMNLFIFIIEKIKNYE